MAKKEGKLTGDILKKENPHLKEVRVSNPNK